MEGTFSFPDGSSYTGEYTTSENGVKVRNGKGSYVNISEKYVGCWVNDKMSGEGMYQFASGAVYQGKFQDGLFSGYGKYSWSDGAVYAGDWLLNKMHGSGTYVDANKVESKGTWYNGMFDSGRSYVSVRPASIPA